MMLTCASVRLSVSLPKIKETNIDCQDALNFNLSTGRFAVSDGATQSFYSGLWSRMLVEAFCEEDTELTVGNWQEWLSPVQERWRHAVEKKGHDLREEGRSSWIETLNGLNSRKPAFATFLGLWIRDGYLSGLGLGDSCLLLAERSDETSDDLKLLRVQPGLWNQEFSNRTVGFSSYADSSLQAPEAFSWPLPEDGRTWFVFLMTDALADYVIRQERQGVSLLQDILQLGDGTFQEFVDTHRERGMQNDDTSLLLIEIPPVRRESAAGESVLSVNSPTFSSQDLYGLLKLPSGDISDLKTPKVEEISDRSLRTIPENTLVVDVAALGDSELFNEGCIAEAKTLMPESVGHQGDLRPSHEPPDTSADGVHASSDVDDLSGVSSKFGSSPSLPDFVNRENPSILKQKESSAPISNESLKAAIRKEDLSGSICRDEQSCELESRRGENSDNELNPRKKHLKRVIDWMHRKINVIFLRVFSRGDSR